MHRDWVLRHHGRQGGVRPEWVLRHRGSVAAVALAGALLAFLDAAAVNIALPALDTALHATTAQGSWVINTFNIVMVAAVVLAGRAADRWGQRRAILAGLALFTMASAWCAASPTVGWLIAGRAIQAVGAAALVPASLALLQLVIRRRVVAVTVWGAVAAAAAGIGPSLGGVLVGTSGDGWRWVFAVNLPVGLVALALAVVTAPRGRASREAAIPDVLAAAVAAVSIAAAAAAIVQAPSWGWTSLRIGALAAVAVAGGIWVIRRSAHHPTPLIALDLLTNRVMATANMASLVFSAAFFATLLNNVLFLTTVWRQSPAHAGLLMTYAPVVAAVIAIPAGHVAEHIGLPAVVMAGAVAFAAGCLAYAHLDTTRQVAAWLTAGGCTGAGTGMVLPVAGSAAMAPVAEDRLAVVAALNAAARQLGAVLGVSILVAVVGAPAPLRALGTFRHGWYTAAGLALLAAVMGMVSALPLSRPSLCLRRRRHSTDGRKDVIIALVMTLVRAARTGLAVLANRANSPLSERWWRDVITQACRRRADGGSSALPERCTSPTQRTAASGPRMNPWPRQTCTDERAVQQYPAPSPPDGREQNST